MPTNELARAKSAMNLDRVRLIMLDGHMARTGNSIVTLDKMLDRIHTDSVKEDVILQRIEKLENEQETINARMHNILRKYNVHGQRGYMAVWHKEHKLYFTVHFSGEQYPFKTNETSQVLEG